MAIGSGDLASFERLLAEGAAPDDGEQPALLESAAHGDHGRMARRLLEAGADPSRSPLALNMAAQHGDVLLVEALIAAGAPERQSNHEMGVGSPRGFPLACAARGGSLACVELISARLSPGDGDTDALTEIAMGIGIDRHDRIDGEQRVDTLAIIEHLVARGGQTTALAHASIAHTTQTWLLEKALDGGADVHAVVTSQGRRLLHVAAEHLRHRMVAALLGRGAALDARDAHGATALDLALAATPSDGEARSAQRLCVTALGGGVAARPAAPSPVPPARGALRAGARVRHPEHGQGTVLKVSGDEARVRFSAALTVEVPCATLVVS